MAWRSTHLMAVIALSIVILFVSILLYAYVTGSWRVQPPEKCMVRVVAVKANSSGLYVWLQPLDCSITIDGGYLEASDGTLVARLFLLEGSVKLEQGLVGVVRLLPNAPVKPGDYLLSIGYHSSQLTIQVHIDKPLPVASVLRNVTIAFQTLTATDWYVVNLTWKPSAGGAIFKTIVCPSQTSLLRGVTLEVYDEHLRLLARAGAKSKGGCTEVTVTASLASNYVVLILVNVKVKQSIWDCLCIYYGDANDEAVEKLWPCKQLVLSPLVDPNLFNPSSVKLGYFSLTTVGGWEPWARMVPDDIVVGYNPTWGEKIVNACDTRWWSIVDYAVNYILSRGFQGVFLDNLDVVDDYPWMKECVVNLVKHIREEHPNIIIIVNRGFSVTDEIAGCINGILVEDFPTYYDFDTGTYRKWTGADLQWYLSVISHLESLSRSYGFNIYLLAYWDTSDPNAAENICTMLLELGVNFPTYIATIDLQTPGYCAPCT